MPKKRDEEALLYAMGREAANVHLGSKRAVIRFCKIYAAGRLAGFVPPQKKWPRPRSATGRNMPMLESAGNTFARRTGALQANRPVPVS